MLTKDTPRFGLWIENMSPAMENLDHWLSSYHFRLARDGLNYVSLYTCSTRHSRLPGVVLLNFVEPKTGSNTHSNCSLQQTSQIVIERVTNSVHNQSIQLIQQWIWRPFLLQASISKFYIGWNDSSGFVVQSINASLAVKVSRLEGIPEKELNSKIFQNSAVQFTWIIWSGTHLKWNATNTTIANQLFCFISRLIKFDPPMESFAKGSERRDLSRSSIFTLHLTYHTGIICNPFAGN